MSDKVRDMQPVRDVLANAKKVNGPTLAELTRDDEADEGFGGFVSSNGGSGDDAPPPRPRSDNLPEECPITALGRDADGRTFYYLNGLNLLTPLGASEHSHNYFMAMCGVEGDYLYKQWPQKKCVKRKNDAGDEIEEWIVTGFNSAQVRDALMQAASLKGVWSPTDKLRGRGAWRDEDGKLILHCGDVLLRSVDGELVSEAPGEVEGFVYSAAPKIPRPSVAQQDKAAAEELRAVLSTWNFSRVGIDADLMFGWICSAMIGGALAVRPICWLTGDKATGKSTLHELLRFIFGDALLSTGDTSSAGLYQRVGPASLPIAVDELEPSAGKDDKRQEDLIKLARNAFSGAVMFRGGADHKGVSFQARSAFLFSSILIPPLGSQDRSRMAILDLMTLKEGTKVLTLDPKHWRAVGRSILRRLLDNWGRFAPTLDAFTQTFMAAGHDMRGAQQLATLMTCRDLALYDYPPTTDELREWAVKLAPSALSEISDTEADHVQCLNHLAQAQPDHWRGGSKYSTAELVAQWMTTDQINLRDDAQAALATGGMRLVTKTWREEADPWPKGSSDYLAVACTHEGTRMLFRDSRWEGRPGLVGVWTQALSRCAGALKSNERIAGKQTRCRLIPVASVCDLPELKNFARDQRAAASENNSGGDQPPSDPFTLTTE